MPANWNGTPPKFESRFRRAAGATSASPSSGVTRMRGPPNGPIAGGAAALRRRHARHRPQRAGQRPHRRACAVVPACGATARIGHLDAARRQPGRHRRPRRLLARCRALAETLQHRHQVDLAAARGERLRGPAVGGPCRRRRPGARLAPRGSPRRPHLRHDVQVLQMPVEIGVDRVDVAERALVELLQDRELDAAIALDARAAPR